MKNYQFDPSKYELDLLNILQDIEANANITGKKLTQILKKHPKDNGLFAKDELVQGYYYLKAKGELSSENNLLAKIKLKPTRSISGVLPLTVLTKPFPCPGRCIFCPNDIRMPKSYLSDEPGAQRAERNNFDPYLQTYNRLLAFHNTGHKVAKIELIILGGTWSYYPEAYQIWFILRCFEALNDFGNQDHRDEVATVNLFKKDEKSKSQFSATGRRRSYNELVTEINTKSKKKVTETGTWEDLHAAQSQNETAQARCVGLVIETRPDHISEQEVIRVRKLGATKTQVGFQSLNDEVLKLNNRGHDVAATIRSVSLLRSAGFKIHAHWMPNLYGSNVELDKKDYLKLFTPSFQPDELKIYPCSLIETAELMDYYNQGKWKPYNREELLDILTFSIANTPRHVRLTRIIRDIPSTDIVVGNKTTNFRQIAEEHLQKANITMLDIRSREIKSQEVSLKDLVLKETSYQAENIYGPVTEKFLEFTTADDKICGFLRISLPVQTNTHFIPELANSAIIREVHVYGVAQTLGEKVKDSSQHLGLGTKLIDRAKLIAKTNGYPSLAVISSIGTKEYYRKQQFRDGKYYQHYQLL